MRVGALTKECELSKHSVKQLKGQVQQLQELLANREQEHRYLSSLHTYERTDLRHNHNHQNYYYYYDLYSIIILKNKLPEANY